MSLYDSCPLPSHGAHTRLLTIKPAADASQDLICGLELTVIGVGRTFEALSYCWEATEASDIAYINGHATLLRPNLAAALRALRYRARDRVVWVDALCINQDDIAEKSVQVQSMRDIYANSSCVIAWLGVATSDSKKAFQALRKKAGKYHRKLTAVLRNPWFQRVWIIQEIAYAPLVLVQAGQQTIHWEDLIRAVESLSETSTAVNIYGEKGQKSLHPSFYPRIINSCRNKIQKGIKLSTLEAFRSFRPFEATRPVDKIFGLLGLLEDPDIVKVDYSKSAQDLYQEVTLALIRLTGRLDVLIDCVQTVKESRLGHMPSWVPDWSDTDLPLDNALSTVLAEETFCAGQGSKLEDATLTEHGTLLLAGHAIGKVAEMGRQIPTLVDLRMRYWPAGRLYPHRHAFDFLAEIVDIWQSWEEVACRTNGKPGTLQDKYSTNESIGEALWYTIEARGPPPPDYQAARQYDKSFESFELIVRMLSWYAANIPTRLHWTIVWIVSGPVLAACSLLGAYKSVRGSFDLDPPERTKDASQQGWVPGRTDNRLFGLFPAPSITSPDAVSSLPGDTIFLFKGSARPFVLREAEGGWRIIGDAYIHGIMHGAAFEEDKCGLIGLV